jgi:hypothetical protein
MQKTISSDFQHQANLDRLTNAELSLSLARDTFRMEEMRMQSIISKSQTLASVSAIVLTAFSIVNLHSDHGAFLRIVGIEISFFCLILFLYILRFNSSYRIDHNFDLTDEALLQDTASYKIKVAKSYSDTMAKSKESVDLLYRIYNYTILSLTCVFVIGVFAAYFEYVKYIV